MTPSHAYHCRALRLLRGVDKPRDVDLRKEMQRFRKLHAAWLGSPQVLGTSVGYRHTGGKETQELAIRVHVLGKLAKGKGKATAWIPPTLRIPGMARALAIDVVEGSAIKVQADASCGDGIACAGVRLWGTLGCTVESSDDGLPPGLLALTCSHVLTFPVGTGVDWLGYPVDSAKPVTPLGKVAYRSKLAGATADDAYPNLYEIALAELVEFDVQDIEHTLGVPTGWRMDRPAMYERLKLFGACSGALSGVVKATDRTNTVEIDGVDYGFSDLVEYAIEDGKSTQPGDSGAAVLDAANRIVGLHLGVDLKSKNAVLMPIAPIVRRFGLRLPGRAPTATAGIQQGSPVAVTSRADAIDILAPTIWGEARGEPDDGMIAVANVVINRVRCRRPGYGLTVEEVCRKPYQFSCWNANDPNRQKLLDVTSADARFSMCQDIARRAVGGTLADLRACSISFDYQHQESQVDELQAGIELALAVLP